MAQHSCCRWLALLAVVERNATTLREWALALGGGLGLALVLVAVARPDMFVFTAQPVATPASKSAPLAALPMPAQIPVQPDDPLPEGLLLLRGVLLPRAAIFEGGDGQQRLVRIGQRLLPGNATLASLTPRSATLKSVDGSERTLMLDGTPPAAIAAAAAPAIAGGANMKATPASLRASSNEYRLALQAVRSGGEVRGWRVLDPAAVPLFRLAGLQRGDVLLRVNDLPLFSEEKIIELPYEVAGAYAVRLEYERAGQRATSEVEMVR